MKHVIITNNPKTAAYIKQQHERLGVEVPTLVFCRTREAVYTTVRDYIHRNWRLQNHAMYGNIQLHKQPYRSMILAESCALDTASLQLWEQAMERATRGRSPDYSERVLEDFQELDFSLFSSMRYTDE